MHRFVFCFNHPPPPPFFPSSVPFHAPPAPPPESGTARWTAQTTAARPAGPTRARGRPGRGRSPGQRRPGRRLNERGEGGGSERGRGCQVSPPRRASITYGRPAPPPQTRWPRPPPRELSGPERRSSRHTGRRCRRTGRRWPYRERGKVEGSGKVGGGRAKTTLSPSSRPPLPPLPLSHALARRPPSLSLGRSGTRPARRRQPPAQF